MMTYQSRISEASRKASPFKRTFKLSLRPVISAQHVYPVVFRTPACEQRSHLIHPPETKVEICVWAGYVANLEGNVGLI